MGNDSNVVLVFGDVGTYGFRHIQERFPERVHNVGILEQSMVGMAAGLSQQQFIPVVHTIASFLVERSYEQLKVDFGYQGLRGNFVSIGASYDMASWGCTHQCPADVGILKNIPGMEIVVPGTAAEFDRLFKQAYADGCPTYFRLSNAANTESHPVAFGEALVLQKGTRATVIAVGPLLGKVQEACNGLDVTLLYYTTLEPFDQKTLRENLNERLVVCEPYYSGACAADIAAAAGSRAVAITYIGVPRVFPHHYGTPTDLDAFFRLTVPDIALTIKGVLAA